MTIGDANIDHLILSGSGFVAVNAKSSTAGTLTTDERSCGVLVHEDGSTRPAPWLNSRRDYSALGIVVRLTCLPGTTLWLASKGSED